MHQCRKEWATIPGGLEVKAPKHRLFSFERNRGSIIFGHVDVVKAPKLRRDWVILVVDQSGRLTRAERDAKILESGGDAVALGFEIGFFARPSVIKAARPVGFAKLFK